jgi:hypothetical protein
MHWEDTITTLANRLRRAGYSAFGASVRLLRRVWRSDRYRLANQPLEGIPYDARS